MKLYRTVRGFLLEEDDQFFSYEENAWTTTSWDALLVRDDLEQHLRAALPGLKPAHAPALNDIEAPIGNQEVWGSGVTYMRSREARMEESKSAGGGDFYDRVYNAPNGPNSSSKRRRSVWLGRRIWSPFATMPPGQCPNPN